MYTCRLVKLVQLPNNIPLRNGSPNVGQEGKTMKKRKINEKYVDVSPFHSWKKLPMYHIGQRSSSHLE